MPCEFVIEDNRIKKNGICSVYNHCARKARGEYLCFLHEDVVFHGNGWGQSVIAQLQKKETGIIGFMGSIYKSKAPSGWNVLPRLNRCHFIQTDKSGGMRRSDEGAGDFRPCLLLDGACLFVRREVWGEIPFDDVLLDGFHCYDIDFSLQAVAKGYRNYVCGTVWLEHLSCGAFSDAWGDATLRLYLTKWQQAMSAKGLDEEELSYIAGHRSFIEARSFYVFLKNQKHRKWDKEERRKLRSFLFRHMAHPVLCLKCLPYLI